MTDLKMVNETLNLILSAPFILPIDQSPIQNGSIVVRDDLIFDLGDAEAIQKKYRNQNFRAIDLPESVILPGFVNAHTHLELTSLQGLPYPGNFTEWIQKVVDQKPKLSDEDYKKGIQQGIQSMLRSGITTIGDHVSFHTDLEWILKSPFRGILFIEILGVVKEVAEEILKAAENLEHLFKDHPSLFQIYASPHSAHAIHPEVLPKIFSKERKALSIHLGESNEEDRYFRNQEGPLYDFIMNRRGAPWRTPNGMGATSSAPTGIQSLESKNLLSNQIMAIHCNYLDKKDLDLLEKHQISVVHCPSSHDYFSHQKFPIDELRERKINIALGTDSLASGNSLSMFDQLRLAQKNFPDISLEEWIQIATLGGAKALKMEKEIGSITPGKKADLIAVQLPSDSKNIFDSVLNTTKISWMMIDGKLIAVS